MPMNLRFLQPPKKNRPSPMNVADVHALVLDLLNMNIRSVESMSKYTNKPHDQFALKSLQSLVEGILDTLGTKYRDEHDESQRNKNTFKM